MQMILDQGQEMTYTLNTHIPLLTCRTQAATASEKSTILFFSYRKALVTKFDHAVKSVKVNPES